jgi:hypothetical protein
MGNGLRGPSAGSIRQCVDVGEGGRTGGRGFLDPIVQVVVQLNKNYLPWKLSFVPHGTYFWVWFFFFFLYSPAARRETNGGAVRVDVLSGCQSALARQSQ